MRLKFAAMNFKKLAGWKAGKACRPFSARFSFVFHSTLYGLSGDKLNRPFFDRLSRYTYYVYRLLVFMLHGGRATAFIGSLPGSRERRAGVVEPYGFGLCGKTARRSPSGPIKAHFDSVSYVGNVPH